MCYSVSGLAKIHNLKICFLWVHECKFELNCAQQEVEFEKLKIEWQEKEFIEL